MACRQQPFDTLYTLLVYRLVNQTINSIDSGPLDEPGPGPEALLRADQAVWNLGPVLRRELQRHPEEVPQHGRQELRLPLG